MLGSKLKKLSVLLSIFFATEVYAELTDAYMVGGRYWSTMATTLQKCSERFVPIGNDEMYLYRFYSLASEAAKFYVPLSELNKYGGGDIDPSARNCYRLLYLPIADLRYDFAPKSAAGLFDTLEAVSSYGGRVTQTQNRALHWLNVYAYADRCLSEFVFLRTEKNYRRLYEYVLGASELLEKSPYGNYGSYEEALKRVTASKRYMYGLCEDVFEFPLSYMKEEQDRTFYLGR